MNKFSVALIIGFLLLVASGWFVFHSPQNRLKSADADLQTAAKSGDSARIEALISQGAQVDNKDAAGWTPLLHAAFSGNEDAVETLLKNGANIEATNPQSYTALYIASWRDHPAVVKLLIDKGADVNAKTNLGRTALETAQLSQKDIYNARRGKFAETVKLLQQAR